MKIQVNGIRERSMRSLPHSNTSSINTMCVDSVNLEWAPGRYIEMKNVVITFNGEHVGGITQAERQIIDEVYPCIETSNTPIRNAERPALVIKETFTNGNQ